MRGKQCRLIWCWRSGRRPCWCSLLEFWEEAGIPLSSFGFPSALSSFLFFSILWFWFFRLILSFSGFCFFFSVFLEAFLREFWSLSSQDNDLRVEIRSGTLCFGWVGTPTVLPLLNCWWRFPRIVGTSWRWRKVGRTGDIFGLKVVKK